ncbi:unnamed protein product [Danaus chrysippus]|uniref:(African queen) hypothetical protein n=1 Tax=Danaus chrysippus TaxID=151541 RepID=A0A8J2R1E9_9NEOP|nr:unnamed protein product [Danaus chrysippus]
MFSTATRRRQAADGGGQQLLTIKRCIRREPCDTPARATDAADWENRNRWVTGGVDAAAILELLRHNSISREFIVSYRYRVGGHCPRPAARSNSLLSRGTLRTITQLLLRQLMHSTLATQHCFRLAAAHARLARSRTNTDDTPPSAEHETTTEDGGRRGGAGVRGAGLQAGRGVEGEVCAGRRRVPERVARAED